MRTSKKLGSESLERRELFAAAPWGEAAIFTDGFESGDTSAVVEENGRLETRVEERIGDIDGDDIMMGIIGGAGAGGEYIPHLSWTQVSG